MKADSLLLLLVILGLLFLTESLAASGRMQRTVAAMGVLVRNRRLMLAALPALIGLLPMPGGALVSAPMVATVDSEERLTSEHRTAINYWYRHIWEYWWPLYPGVVVALRYSMLPAPVFYALQVPLTLAALIGGYFFVLQKTNPGGTLRIVDGDNRRASYLCDMAAGLVPILGVVFVSVMGATFLPRVGVSPSFANLIAMLLGLVAALTLVFTGAPQAFGKAVGFISSSKTWELLLVVVGVQMFAAILKYPLADGGETLVTRMANEFMDAGIPVVMVMVVVPALAGFVTGVAVGFVAVSFPLVFGLLGDSPSMATLAGTTMLAYVSGYTGMMLSPIHVCFVVSNQYFNVRNIIRVYRFIFPASAVVFACGVLLAYLYRCWF